MLNFFVSLLYPKKCVRCRVGGAYICADCFVTISFLQYQLCGVCRKGSVDGMTHPGCKTPYGIDAIISTVAYKGIVKKLLNQFKNPPYLSDLKGILGKIFYEGLIQEEGFISFLKKKNTVFVPVPIHKTHERKRGYNQSELLAQELSKRFNIKMTNMLFRKIDKKPQFEFSKKERRGDIGGAFVLNKKHLENLKVLNVILVEDNTKTGATLRECAKVLKVHGVKKVMGITLTCEG